VQRVVQPRVSGGVFFDHELRHRPARDVGGKLEVSVVTDLNQLRDTRDLLLVDELLHLRVPVALARLERRGSLGAVERVVANVHFALHEVGEPLQEPDRRVVGVVLEAVQHQMGEVEHHVRVHRRVDLEAALLLVDRHEQRAALHDMPALRRFVTQSELTAEEVEVEGLRRHEQDLEFPLLAEVRPLAPVWRPDHPRILVIGELNVMDLHDLGEACVRPLRAQREQVSPQPRIE